MSWAIPKPDLNPAVVLYGSMISCDVIITVICCTGVIDVPGLFGWFCHLPCFSELPTEINPRTRAKVAGATHENGGVLVFFRTLCFGWEQTLAGGCQPSVAVPRWLVTLLRRGDHVIISKETLLVGWSGPIIIKFSVLHHHGQSTSAKTFR